MSRVSRIAPCFAALARQRRRAFIPYVTAGDPSLGVTAAVLDGAERHGADLLELGVPFSDPIADGPVNQRAAQRALAAGTTLDSILDLARGARRRGVGLPLVLFTYFNPVHRFGCERFASAASRAGIDGVLVTDLPPEEASPLVTALSARGIDPIFLLSPTSDTARLRAVAAVARGFVYLVSRTGVTGERQDVAGDLAADFRRARRRITLPIAVGFGISTPAQVEAVGRFADGIVVGSAIVRAMEGAGEAKAAAAALAKIAELSAPLRKAIQT